MADFNFDKFLNQPEIEPFKQHFSEALDRRTSPARHGDLASWLATLNSLPDVQPSAINLNSDAIAIGRKTDLNTEQQAQLLQSLQELIPWRKGPFNFFDVLVDTEWRSDWKWQRLLPHINSLENKRILDVGCGNGYHCWRMLGAGAESVVGIDPSMRFFIQHLAVQKYLNNQQFDFLPLGIEDIPQPLPIFDSVFSMGVLYHRRNPINHIQELHSLLKPNGELVLETLIVDQAENGILTPTERYAMMRNVWSITTVDKTLELLNQAGFKQVRCVDQTITTTDEQRVTDWMQFHSLANFLDPNDSSKTIEGYPAPKRGIFIATK